MTVMPASVSSALSSDDDYVVDVWDVDRGLPHSSVTSIAQTPDGYLWVGTLHGGLARFDGVRFVTFHPGNTPELPSIEIQRLAVDPAGTLWIGVVEGALLSRRNGRFQFEREDTQTPNSWLGEIVASRTNEIIFSSLFGWVYRGDRVDGTNRWRTFKPPGAFQGTVLCEDREGVIWYNRANFRLGRIRGEKAELLDTWPGLANQRIGAVAKDRDGNIWVGTQQELAMWNGRAFVNRTPTNAEPSVIVQQIVAAPDGGLWIQVNNQIRKFQKGQFQNGQWTCAADFAAIQLPAQSRPTIRPDSQGGAWLIKSGAGLWHINATGDVAQIGIAQGLPSNLLECWFEDREGNVWVGLSGGGLACVRKRVFHSLWPGEGSRNRAARSVSEDRSGNLWFGTSGDKVLRWADGKFSEWSPPPTNVPSLDITVCPDAEDRLWVGTVQNGVWILETNVMRRAFPSAAVGTVARALYKDRAGRMWIGNEFGLFCWENGRLKKFTAADGFASAYILSITEDNAGTLWLGTAVGELRSYRDGKFTSFWPSDVHHPNAEVETGSTNDVPRGTLSGGERFWAIYPDRDGVLWIGTLGGGLLRFKNGQFTRYNTHHGLPNEHDSKIIEDRQGQLWLGTRGGIARVKREVLKQFARGEIESVPFITYGKSDGLPSIECSGGYQPGCWAGADGRLWFTTVKGAAWINPQQVPFNPLPPPVLLEELRVDNELIYEPNPGPQLTRATARPLRVRATPGDSKGATLQIPAGQHYFQFKFTALSLVSPDKVRFKWRLLGADRDWVDGGTDRSAGYPLLPAGDYEFEVQASNNDGVWTKESARLKFSVLPYFWQTWWFKAVIALAVAGVLFLIYSIRIARLHALERLRLRIARDLHDDVGSNLGSISLLAQVMEKTPNAEDAHHVRSIVAQTVDTLRDIVWFIDPTHERLSDLVARMAETAKTMLVTIPFTFKQTGDFRSASLPLDFRRNVMPIFKEVLHNAIKHAEASQIAIEVFRTKDVFEFTVQDNGRGFDLSHRQSGNGLKNIRRRAAEMKADLNISSDQAQGTKVKLTARIP